MDSVESTGYATYAASFGSDSTLVIVAGDIESGEVVRLHVPDIGATTNYGAAVKEAVSRSTFASQDPAGYIIAVSR